MVILSRIVRFNLSEGVPFDAGSANNYAGSPTPAGLSRHYTLEVRCRGEMDPVADYLVDIKEVDKAAKASVLPALASAAIETPAIDPGALMIRAFPALDQRLGGRALAARLHLSPFLSYEIERDTMDTILLRQKFDFAASHRLHNPNVSDEENRRLYGKCNNPRGHGHNYQVEPCVAVRVAGAGAGAGAGAFRVGELERIVDDLVISKFDHRYLNEETQEFATGKGLNPSVENIAKVIYEMLSPAIRNANPAAILRNVTVWETDRTSATYPG